MYTPYDKHFCPRCKQEYYGFPAISRVDNKTEICPECGTREAFIFFGFPESDLKEVLVVLRKQQNSFKNKMTKN